MDTTLFTLALASSISAVVIISLIIRDAIIDRNNPLKRAYREGWKAYHKGSSFMDNKYAIGTEESTRWALGWKDAREEHEWEM